MRSLSSALLIVALLGCNDSSVTDAQGDAQATTKAVTQSAPQKTDLNAVGQSEKLELDMTLDEALAVLAAAGIQPEEVHPAIAVEGSAEWKLYRVGRRDDDAFYLLASRTTDEMELRVIKMYWWINAVTDGKLPKSKRANDRRSVSEVSIDELAAELDATPSP